MNFFNLTSEETAEKLKSSLESGLDEAEAKNRLAEFGLNRLSEQKGPGPLVILLGQFNNFIIWVLIGAAAVSGFLREWVDALAIIAIVIINGILGFVQEYRAERSLQALKKLTSPVSKVVRSGALQPISSSKIVPGDLIELEAGDNVPADCRLVYASANFSVQEASLTGESVPAEKNSAVIEKKEIPLGDMVNLVFMGTSAVSGRARAMAIGTGMNTELGKIAGMIREVKEDPTPLQKKLEQFGKWIVALCFILTGMVFVIEYLRGGEILEVFLTAVSLAVAAIPEGLPAAVTLVLALGVQRMSAKKALVRRLPSVETLGCATVICSDKTGTLTKNEMTVKEIYSQGLLFSVGGSGYEMKGDLALNGAAVNPDNYPAVKQMLLASVLCNNADIKEGKAAGDPTEAALIACAGKFNLLKKEAEAAYPLIDEIPFDAQRKKMTVVRKDNLRYAVFVKGAPEILLNDCAFFEEASGAKQLDDDARERILKVNSDLAKKAMRVLAAAYKIVDQAPGPKDFKNIENGLVFLGLFAMIDPPREEAKEAVKKCRSAGIRTIMITGDHKETAVAIGRELGFDSADIYARVSPEDKLRIVRDLRKRGEVVAMTGDGVNDAPAVKEADIGVAMGITGTDVTKEVSDLIITDDNFASIVAAVEEGRGVYANIKKFIHYLLSCNVGEIMVMFAASLIGLPPPLFPIQILWVNLVTDGLPALALGVDPADPKIMQIPPRKSDQPVIEKSQAGLMLMQGVFIAICCLLAFTYVFYVEQESLGRARTAAFIVLAASQLFHSFNCRSNTESIFKIGFLSNPRLVFAGLISFLVLISTTLFPFFQKIFKTQNLTLFDWAMVIIISTFPLFATEIYKRLRRLHGKIGV